MTQKKNKTLNRNCLYKMASTVVLISITLHQNLHFSPLPKITMLSELSFFLLLTLIFSIFTLYTVPKNINKQENNEKQGTAPKRMVVLHVIPSNSPKLVTLFGNVAGFGGGSGHGKKKRAKKGSGKEDLVGFLPFSTKLSDFQRKIMQHYDQLVKTSGTKDWTVEQVRKFDKCLAEARNVLQKKSQVLKRKFSVAKALLMNGDRSSYVRLCKQMHNLEFEKKRLQEDASVYNWLQDQLRASPAYYKMLEISAATETKEESSFLFESEDDDFSDISFEEMLEQEKKDPFWQKNGKVKPCSG